jgi:hypothetical protein
LGSGRKHSRNARNLLNVSHHLEQHFRGNLKQKKKNKKRGKRKERGKEKGKLQQVNPLSSPFVGLPFHISASNDVEREKKQHLVAWGDGHASHKVGSEEGADGDAALGAAVPLKVNRHANDRHLSNSNKQNKEVP